ncbi:MAG: hypothetical protein GY804_10425 [Alphaproteobacteria bacterium]|nr:hypothetical protein [Alphaproteobacteria bacterium]
MLKKQNLSSLGDEELIKLLGLKAMEFVACVGLDKLFATNDHNKQAQNALEGMIDAEEEVITRFNDEDLQHKLINDYIQTIILTLPNEERRTKPEARALVIANIFTKNIALLAYENTESFTSGIKTTPRSKQVATQINKAVEMYFQRKR